MGENLRKLYFLDSLRGIAILLVLLVHSGGQIELFGSKLALTNLGQRGVQLFYEVSAFSLLYSFYSRKEGSWKAFYIRRFFRIAPLFYFSITANLIISLYIYNVQPLTVTAYAAGFLFLFGFHPSTINAVAPAGWSIAVETTFYALFPFMAVTIRNLGAALAFAAVSVLTCFLLCYQLNVYPLTLLPGEYLHFLWFPVEFPVFCFGFVAFWGWRDLCFADPNRQNYHPILINISIRKIISLGLLAGAGLVVYIGFPVNNFRLYFNSISFVFFILALALYPWSLFVNPITRYVGKLSFSIYLVHPYLTYLVSWFIDNIERRCSLALYGHNFGLLLSFLAYLGGSLLIAQLTFPFIESVGITFGKKVVRKLRVQDGTCRDSDFETGISSMDVHSELEQLRAKLRTCYVLWIVSLVAVFLFIFVYNKTTSDTMNGSAEQHRMQIDAYQAQVETLSAEILKNQRSLVSTQNELKQAIEVIKQLQVPSKN